MNSLHLGDGIVRTAVAALDKTAAIWDELYGMRHKTLSRSLKRKDRPARQCMHRCVQSSYLPPNI